MSTEEIASVSGTIDQSLRLSLMVVSFDETQIQDGCGSRGNHIARQRANIATGKAVDIQRWKIDQLQQRLAAAFRALQS